MKAFLKRQWPMFGVCILLVLFCFYLLKFGRNGIQDNLVEHMIPGEGLTVNDFRFTQNNPDKDMTWTINAKKMRSLGGESIFEFSDFQIKITPKSKPSFELSGLKGKYSRDSGEITLAGSLVGTSENGYQLNTERITIHEKEKLITTDDDEPVKIIGPLFSVFGQGLSVDLEEETTKILSNVSAVIYEGLPTG